MVAKLAHLSSLHKVDQHRVSTDEKIIGNQSFIVCKTLAGKLRANYSHEAHKQAQTNSARLQVYTAILWLFESNQNLWAIERVVMSSPE